MLVSAFDWTLAERVRALRRRRSRPDCCRSVYRPTRCSSPRCAAATAAVHPDVWTLLTLDIAGFVARAHDQDVQVNVWTVNDAAQVEMLRDAGVDAVITDDSDLYQYGVRGRRR